MSDRTCPVQKLHPGPLVLRQSEEIPWWFIPLIGLPRVSYFSPAFWWKSQRHMEGAASAHSYRSSQSRSNVTKSNDEASSLVAPSRRSELRGFFSAAQWGRLCESVWEAGRESQNFSLGWRCKLHFLAPTQYVKSQHPPQPPHPSSPVLPPPPLTHSPAETRRWRPHKIHTTS